MKCTGTVRNGAIILDNKAHLTEGSRVEIALIEESTGDPTLIGLLKYAGCIKDMPPNFAAEHDHYIPGTP